MPVAKPTKPAKPTKSVKPAKLTAKPGNPKTKPEKRIQTPNRLAVAEVFRRFYVADPEPKGELDYVNAYTLLVAVVLSAQSTDVGVNKATKGLFAAADTPQKMVLLGAERIRDHIKTIGLFRTKAKHVMALSDILIRDFGGEVPTRREQLETLPGVGRKTANVVLNIFFGQPCIAVDTHLFRVSNRIPLSPGKTPLAVELGLMKIIPPEYMRHAHHWLILHGRYICKARAPLCSQCLIIDLCRFPDKNLDGKNTDNKNMDDKNMRGLPDDI